MCTLTFDGKTLTGPADRPLIDFLAGHGIDLPHVCYHPALGPLQTCDVCWVETGGELVRGCTLRSRDGLQVTSRGLRAASAREEGMDRLLAKHELYCTVCENNTGDCTLHNTFAGMGMPIQRYPFHFHTDDGRAVLYPLEWKPPAEAPDAEYDLALDNGRMLEHFQATNQTGKDSGICHEVPDWFVEVSPELAAERGIEDGTWVCLTSRRGSIEVRAVVTDRVHGKLLYLPIHHSKPAANALTGEHHDPDVNTPGYKETAVKLAVLPKPRGAPPLPHHNYRYGHRTPNDGPHVEAKWSRPDYTRPPAPQAHPERM